MPKYNQNFIACDTETGGLPSVLKKQATIEVALTEVALVSIDNETLEIKDKDSWLIKPYVDDLIYEKKAAEVSGISKAMCEKEGIELEQVYKNFVAFLVKGKKGSNKPILIFHNAPFDTPFIENLFIIFNDDLYKYIDRIEDTLPWARLKWIEKPKFSLGAVAEYCGLDHTQAHRALPDTIITAQVWCHFMRNLRSEGSSSSVNEVKFRDTFRF